MSSSGYSEYRSDSWVEDDHTNKSSNQKRDKRSEFDRYILNFVNDIDTINYYLTENICIKNVLV